MKALAVLIWGGMALVFACGSVSYLFSPTVPPEVRERHGLEYGIKLNQDAIAGHQAKIAQLSKDLAEIPTPAVVAKWSTDQIAGTLHAACNGRRSSLSWAIYATYGRSVDPDSREMDDQLYGQSGVCPSFLTHNRTLMMADLNRLYTEDMAPVRDDIAKENAAIAINRQNMAKIQAKLTAARS
jgi:hypothetical protein